jgi:hypothetical protein
MINHEIFKEVEPSFEKVLLLRDQPIDLDATLKLLEKYRDEVVKDYNTFSDSADYLFCQRAIHLFKWKKDVRAFNVVFEIFENLDEEDEILSSSCALYLQQEATIDQGQFLFEKWKSYNYHADDFEFSIFEIIIHSGFENNEIVDYMIETLSDPPDENWLKDSIALKVNNEVIQKEVVKRLKFVAPMVKYIEAPREIHDYLEEWYELGSAYVERKYKLHDFDDKYLKEGDENFIIDILGHSDDRSTDLMLKRSDLYIIDKEKIAQEIKEREDILKREFLDVLPPKLQEWLDSMGVPEEHKDELMDEYYLIQRAMAPKVKPRKLMKIGRNDPCTCNSGKKYKKCCGI